MDKIIVIIKREVSYSDMFRDYQVIIDDNVVSNLKPMSEIELEAKCNSTIKLKIDWCYSNTVQVDCNNLKNNKFNLIAKSNISGWKIFLVLYYVLFDKNKYLKLLVDN